ncbi:MAG: single-stranded DNA-binding protein [Nitrospinota bacterium]
MASLNSVFLRGNLTRDPELRYLPSGTPVVSFGLAVPRRFRRGEEWQEEVCFVDVTAFGRQAEACNANLTKGSAVLIDGRLQYRTWEGEGGTRRSKHEVVANNVHILARAKAAGPGPVEPPAEPPPDDDIPF